jgi:dimethylglycine catabolism A
MAGITRWFQLELARLNVDLRLGVAADAATILDLRPTSWCWLWAGTRSWSRTNTGARPKGWWSAVGTCSTARWRRVKTCWCTTPFANSPACRWPTFWPTKAAQVEIVTDDIKPGVAIGGTSFPTYYRSLYPKEVIMTGDMMLEKVYREGDKLIAVLENEYTGAREERVVDQVVVENGVRPDEEMYYALKPGSRNKGQIDVEALFAIQPQPCLSEPGDGLLAVPHRRLRGAAQRACCDL